MYDLEIDKNTGIWKFMPTLFWKDTSELPKADIELAATISQSSSFSSRDRFLHFMILLRSSLAFCHPFVQSALVSFLTSTDRELQGTALHLIRVAATLEFVKVYPGWVSNLSERDRNVLLTAVLTVQDRACSPFKFIARAILGDPQAFEEALLLAENRPPDRPKEERDLEWCVQTSLHMLATLILEGKVPSARARIMPD